ncbi:c-type cytochrome [Candidatus Entotheonella palauensis]|uniref:c-type cytochrome n=1 Tax=Candidatus Entotheonella palauensis TaxID=93172 RepID=UPI0015C44DA1|nr:c-type cytochrome [Candidatus Entotheonella palauensis]
MNDRYLTLLLACLSAIAIFVSCGPPSPPSPPLPPSPPPLPPGPRASLSPVCDTPLQPPVLAYYLPRDVEGNLLQDNRNVIQRAVDIFSWQEFIALNWPAKPDERGMPDLDKPVTAEGPRLWETWKEEYEVYLPDGNPPASWNNPQGPPVDAQGNPLIPRVMFRNSKIHDVADSKLQAEKTDGTLLATLKDQNGRLVRYEIRMNQVMFDYIVENELYNGLKQAAFGQVSFPYGSMITKAAWREITAEEANRYVTTEAVICDSDPDTRRVISCQPHTTRMGLVGLHIMAKTPSAPQWLWSTFEHVDNAPAIGRQTEEQKNWSFYLPGSLAPINEQTKPGIPNQVVRPIPVSDVEPDCSKSSQAVDNLAHVNAVVQEKLAQYDSVLQHYELIGTQWPIPRQHSMWSWLSEAPPQTVFDAMPTFLANTTMETFVPYTSSCMGCHSRARKTKNYVYPSQDDLNKYPTSDFTFTLNNALPKPTTPWSLPAPIQECSESGTKTPAQKGYCLATHTYEDPLTKPHVSAKLHCSSCHLQAGRHPTAAWWVGMIEKYGKRQSSKYNRPSDAQYWDNQYGWLPHRINGCFQRSMNGTVLCQPGNNGCDDNEPMQALIAYMAWLDKTIAQQQPSPNTPLPTWDGFPTIDTEPYQKQANANRGEQIFLQKCSVCHGEDGQGRFGNDHNTYLRPPLWGKYSFNQSAGLSSKPQKLAGFIRWNMPLDHGGVISNQEAWDLATYIGLQWRPRELPHGNHD